MKGIEAKSERRGTLGQGEGASGKSSALNLGAAVAALEDGGFLSTEFSDPVVIDLQTETKTQSSESMPDIGSRKKKESKNGAT